MEQADRPHVISLPDRPTRRLSLPNSVYDVPGTHNSPQSQTSNQNSSLWTTDTTINIGRAAQNYVEDTIFYDQFEDRRIDVSKSARSNTGFTYRPAPPVPFPRYDPPVAFNTQPSDDGFRLPPLPVIDIPDPPPAYTEIDEQRDRNTVPVTPVFRGHQMSAGLPRKLVTCPCCRTRVYTIVIRESGVLTHVIAAIVFFVCLPIVFCIYLTNVCKYKNHYCPNCNSMIGYEIPLLCTEMVYTRSCVEQNITRG